MCCVSGSFTCSTLRVPHTRPAGHIPRPRLPHNEPRGRHKQCLDVRRVHLEHVWHPVRAHAHDGRPRAGHEDGGEGGAAASGLQVGLELGQLREVVKRRLLQVVHRKLLRHLRCRRQLCQQFAGLRGTAAPKVKALEDLRCGQPHRGLHQQHRCRQRQWWRDILHDLAPPRAIRRAVAEKHRYVRPNVARPLKQLRVARRTARQLVGRPQRCRGVAAAAAEAGPVRHLFHQVD
mmetsp:Transcript_27114/g.80408  ORF Transcript_27114/g.80408 Transcript_27114/m.80408 type:complete len:233 (+) Transcript_27114:342-1040(+)